ncbi:MAG: hypothetical protein AAF385_14365, partial [Pseudomonadota bacterium]
MDFSAIALKDSSIGIEGKGRILQGDADRLRDAVKLSRARPDGWTPLFLNSGGGNVDAALDMASVIREHKLMPVVRSGEFCESSCASILILAGEKSLVAQGGSLFYHACATQDATVELDGVCNDLISGIMRDEFGVDYEMLLRTLDGFLGDEAAVSREDRLIAA